MQLEETINDLKNKKGVLLVDSQPPHVGEFLQARQMLDKYDFLYVCITKGTMVIPVDQVAKIWAYLFSAYGDRMKITYVELEFGEALIDDLPGLFDKCVYLTSDRDVFVHLSTLDIDVELIPRSFGYHGIFLRNAYRQSKALDWLEFKYINQAKTEKIIK